MASGPGESVRWRVALGLTWFRCMVRGGPPPFARPPALYPAYPLAVEMHSMPMPSTLVAMPAFSSCMCVSFRQQILLFTSSHCPCSQVGLSAAPPPSVPPPPVPPAGAAPGSAESEASGGPEACGGRDAGAGAAGAAAEGGRPSEPDQGPTAGGGVAAEGLVDAQTVADAVFRQVRGALGVRWAGLAGDKDEGGRSRRQRLPFSGPALGSPRFWLW